MSHFKSVTYVMCKRNVYHMDFCGHYTRASNTSVITDNAKQTILVNTPISLVLLSFIGSKSTLSRG